MDSINGISYYLNKCLTLSNTSQMTFFISGKIAHRCIVCVTQSQLSEICDFRVSAFCQVVQKHKLFEVA